MVRLMLSASEAFKLEQKAGIADQDWGDLKEL